MQALGGCNGKAAYIGNSYLHEFEIIADIPEDTEGTFRPERYLILIDSQNITSDETKELHR
jgi:hypothetical protein